METTYVSNHRWVDKDVYINNRICLSHKKEQNFAICTNMEELGRHYAKWNKSDRERHILYDITYMWNLKQYNRLVNTTKKKQTQGSTEQSRLPAGRSGEQVIYKREGGMKYWL